MGATDLDFSIRTAPSSWVEPQAETPDPTYREVPHQRPAVGLAKAHTGEPAADLAAGMVLLLFVSFVAGGTWYALQLSENAALSYWAIGIGLLYAAVMRFSAGKGEPELRAMVCAITYTTTVFVVTYLVSRHNFQSIYGTEPGPSDINDWVVRTRLRSPSVVISWVVGFWLTISVNYVLTRRTRRFR